MKYLVLLLVIISFNAIAVKVVVPAQFQSLSESEIEQIKQADLSNLSVNNVEQYAFYVFLNALKDQEIELIYIDQKQKAQAMLYESKAAVSLFLFENTQDESPRSSHFEYSSAVIEVNQWHSGIFTCNESNAFNSIGVIQTDAYLTKTLAKQFPKHLINISQSWPLLIRNCINNQEALLLPLAMKNQKMMNQPLYFTNQYVPMPYSYHIVFSAQNSDTKKIKALFEKRFLDISKPVQGEIE